MSATIASANNAKLSAVYVDKAKVPDLILAQGK